MKVILHGKLRQLFGAEYEIATTVPADAIEGLSRQLDWPKELLIDVVDFDTEEKLRSTTKVSEIHLVPSVYGGSGVAKIFIGAAIIATALVIGPSALAWGFTFMMSVGASLVLSGVMELFFKAPTVNKSDDPPASKYLGNNGNTTAIGTYRNLCWGQVRVAGHWLSMQVDAKSIVLGRFPTTPPA